MIPAQQAIQRPHDARLLVVQADGRLSHRPRAHWVDLLQAGDLLVANDAATLPASLHGVHGPSGRPIELRLAGRASLAADDVQHFTAVLLGEGDHRTPTEHRPAPPAVQPGDRLRLGDADAPLHATVQALLGHPRLLAVQLHGDAPTIWAALARHGRPVQYAHLHEPLALWDVWTPIAANPAAFEPPSAGFVLDWASLRRLQQRGVGFATLTHAAGLSSTGDSTLDARLPLDEPYRIPQRTALLLARTRAAGGRIVAVGTTVTRALEHAGRHDGRVRAGDGVADQRLGPRSVPRVVDVLLSGTHEPGTSHHQLLQAFVSPALLARVDAALEREGYRTHEFGDSVWVECQRCGAHGHRPRLQAA